MVGNNATDGVTDGGGVTVANRAEDDVPAGHSATSSVADAGSVATGGVILAGRTETGDSGAYGGQHGGRRRNGKHVWVKDGQGGSPQKKDGQMNKSSLNFQPWCSGNKYYHTIKNVRTTIEEGSRGPQAPH